MTTKPKNPRGRPALGPGRGAQGKSISTRVDLEELDRLLAHCQRAGISVSRMLRGLLEPYIRKPS